jgi:nucleoside-diphosphate-sugar epimerase
MNMQTESIKVGVTGASGFIGKALISYLSSKGFSVTGFTTGKTGNNLINLDLADEKQVEIKFADLDILIHSAWVGSDRKNRFIPEIQKKNVSIAKNIGKVYKVTNISKIIGIGSQDELVNGEQPWADNSKILPLSEYAKAKYESFKIFSEHANNFTWARLFSIYGKNDQREWIFTKAIDAIKNNLPIVFGKCSKPWSLTHVNDVATAFEMLIKNDIKGVVNVSNLDAPLLRSHLELMQLLSKKELFTFVNTDIDEREVSRTSGILETIGWKPTVKREEAFLDLLK